MSDRYVKACCQYDYIIPPDFFDISKPLVLAEILYCPRNETLSKCFIKNFMKSAAIPTKLE